MRFYILTISFALLFQFKDTYAQERNSTSNYSYKVTTNTSEKNNQYFVDMKAVSKDRLEAEVLSKVGASGTESITIRSDETVEMKNVVFIMDIANRNKIKSTLAVKAQ